MFGKKKHPLQSLAKRKPESQELVPVQEQYALDIKRSKLDPLYNVQNKLNKVTDVIEALPYWRSIVTIGAIMAVVTLVILSMYLIVDNYQDLPSQFPLIHSQATNSWTLIDKEILPLVPIFIAVIGLISVRFNSVVFKFDRRLAQIVNIGLILCGFLGIIAFLQLFSLILVY